MARMAQFGHYGCQHVELSHRLAASMMATTPVEGLRMPWPSFAVRIPSGLIFVDGDDGVLSAEFIIIRECLDDGVLGTHELVLWAYPLSLHIAAYGLDELGARDRHVARDSPMSDAFSRAEAESHGGYTPRDSRALTLATRLALGVIAELESSGATVVSGGRRTEHAKPPRKVGQPWVLSRPVVVDVRSEVRDFCMGGGRVPSVRTMVRGHWRRQPHGPGSTLRKMIHIEPFWRGPEDGPMPLRSHTIRDGEKS